MESRPHSRRKFIRNAATGLMVPSLMGEVLRGSVPIPLGFWKGPAASGGGLGDDWKSRMLAEGGTVNDTQLGIANTFLADIASIRSKIKRLNLWMGGGENLGTNFLPQLTIPLINDYGDVKDTLVNNTTPAWGYAENTGPNPNNLSYIKTGFNASVLGLTDDFHCSVYARTYPGDQSICLGAYVDGTTGLYLTAGYNSGGVKSYFHAWNNTDIIYTDPTRVGLYTGSRRAAGDAELYLDGTSVGTSTMGGVPSNLEIYVFSYNVSGTSTQATGRTMEMYSLGLALSDSDAATLSSAYATARTALGR